MALLKLRPDIDKLWKEYKAGPSVPVRNTLMEEYLPIVRYVAERIRERLPKNVEVDDLVEAGIFGLMDAIDRFDLSRNVKFETYCTNRIRGAILDDLRNLDWVPRLVRSRAHQLEEAHVKIERETGRAPTDSEVAKAMNVTNEEYDTILREVSAATMVNAGGRRPGDKEENAVAANIELMEDRSEPDPSFDIAKKELVEYVTRSLTKKERLILLLYYYEDLTLKEIGRTLELSESRVCQLHSKVLLKLRTQLQKRRAELV